MGRDLRCGVVYRVLMLCLLLVLPGLPATTSVSKGPFKATPPAVKPWELAAMLDLRCQLRFDTQAEAAIILDKVSPVTPRFLGQFLYSLKKRRSAEAAVATVLFALDSQWELNTKHWTLALQACRRAR